AKLWNQGGLTIRTTLDPQSQQSVQNSIAQQPAPRPRTPAEEPGIRQKNTDLRRTSSRYSVCWICSRT
ncbi:hypothetical protein ACWD6K_33480, partial [Streptomyces sp. NPDC002431]